MNPHRRLFLILAAALFAFTVVRADEPATPPVPASPAVPAVPPAPPREAVPPSGGFVPAKALSPIRAELQVVVNGVKAKLQSGGRTEADLRDQLNGFDQILAKHKGESPEELAFVTFMKAMLYVEVLRDFDKGTAIMTQIKTDFPGTQMAAKADGMIESITRVQNVQKVQASLVPGAVFPDFDEKDTAGQPLSVANYKGKLVLVDFWATWCPPCVAEVPSVVAAYQKYHDKGFEIIGVSLDKEEGKMKEFTAAKGMTWAQYFDGKGWGNKLVQKYGVNSIPATFLIDGEGKVIASGLRGPALEAELEKRLGK